MADSDSTKSDDQDSLIAYLRGLGAGDTELQAAAETRRLGALALDVALRGDGPPLPFDDAVQRAGLDVEEGRELWRALGFPDPRLSSPTVSADMADVLLLLSLVSRQLFGRETTSALARVMGASALRLAETIVDAFRTGVEVPELAGGTPYSELVESYVELVTEGLPHLLDAVVTLIKRHMVGAATGAWMADESGALRRDLTVGFADLVGFTALSRSLGPAELAGLVRHFEAGVAEVISDRGRLVKFMGDGAMFVFDRPEDACGAALSLVDRFRDDDVAPPIRVGLAYGPVLSLFGDYFGDVVNLSARLVALAYASTVVVAEDVANRTVGFSFDRIPARSLKGFHAPLATFRLVGPINTMG